MFLLSGPPSIVSRQFALLMAPKGRANRPAPVNMRNGARGAREPIVLATNGFDVSPPGSTTPTAISVSQLFVAEN